MRRNYFTILRLIALLIIMLPLQVEAQKYPTRFLGFPVDGPKSVLIDSLKAKGFTYNVDDDYLTGVYFGEPVYIFINTRDNRVNRVLVYDIIQRDSFAVKKRFNEVYRRFKDNKNYVYMSGKKGKISTNENIAIEIGHYSRNYKSVYGQLRKSKADSLAVLKNGLIPSTKGEVNYQALKTNVRERLRRIHAMAIMRTVSTTDDRYMNQVWFTISEKHGKYAVIHSFDNLYNFTQPEDDEE